MHRTIWEPVGHLQGSLRPSGPETPKKSEKKSPGASGPRTPRVWKRSRKSPESLEIVSKRSRETLGGVPGPEAPGDFLQTFSGFRAQRARETPVNGQRVPNARLGDLRFVLGIHHLHGCLLKAQSAGKKGTAGGLLGAVLRAARFLWKSREAALLPAVVPPAVRHSSQHSPRHFWGFGLGEKAHFAAQRTTIAQSPIAASEFRVDEAKSPEIPQKEGARARTSQLEIANR